MLRSPVIQRLTKYSIRSEFQQDSYLKLFFVKRLKVLGLWHKPCVIKWTLWEGKLPSRAICIIIGSSGKKPNKDVLLFSFSILKIVFKCKFYDPILNFTETETWNSILISPRRVTQLQFCYLKYFVNFSETKCQFLISTKFSPYIRKWKSNWPRLKKFQL